MGRCPVIAGESNGKKNCSAASARRTNARVGNSMAKEKLPPPAQEAEGTLERVASLDWAAIRAELDGHGSAVIGPLLAPEQCAAVADSYDSDEVFRSRVVMARHGFGR